MHYFEKEKSEERIMKGDTYNILMVGVGGQGIILASDIITRGAMIAGYDAKKSEIHGMSQRGGSVFSHIRFGEKVYSPTIAEGEADILFSLEEMETLRWIRYANPETFVICTTRQILPPPVTDYPSGVREELTGICPGVIFFDPDTLKEEIENVKFLNVAMLGLMAPSLDIPEKAWQDAIREEVPDGTFEGNWNAFQAGRTVRAV
jgi:indolepyruvate ferredoxin oxidoreductase, beta subunit